MSDPKHKIRVRDAKTGEDLPPRAQPGYYPGFSTMDQKPHWDDATQKIVENRMKPDKPIRFFTPEEIPVMQAVLDCVMPQDDRDADHQIPVLALIDARLHDRKFDGYIYEGTVEDDITHRLGLQAVEAIAQAKHQKSFAALYLREREAILVSIRDSDPGPQWTCSDKGVPPAHYWSVINKDAVSAYYSHPYSWDEIGFGGPAYPRGYMRLTGGLPEPWEKDEQRYDWLAPAETVSDTYRDNEELFAQPVKTSQSGSR